MKYLFILGRNIKLSKVEILSYLKKENNSPTNYELNKNALLTELNNPLASDTINVLGGTIAIGKVLSTTDNLNSLNIYEGAENKLTYCLWNFSKKFPEIKDYLKKRFKKEKLKATEKLLSDKIETQFGEQVSIPSSRLIQEQYFVFNDFFGKLTQFTNPKAIEARDMEKPVRRESLAISPRLAKILINLAELKSGDTLFDPFCGVGTILSEALLQNINVLGVDKDSKAISGAKKNLNYFNFNKNNYHLINSDSIEVEIPEVNAIATEPDLGEKLKKIPTKEKALNTLKQFENLMIGVINNSKEKTKGKIVFTSPYIRIGKKRLSCDIEKICEKTGYNLTQPGIEEFRHNQFVGRMIFILSK